MLTPQEAESHVFPKASFGGYNMLQVDTFLDSLIEDYRTLYQENTSLKNKMKVLVDKVEEYRATEDAMRMTLHSAQKMADAMRDSSRELSQSYTSFVENISGGLSRTMGLFEENMHAVVSLLDGKLESIEKTAKTAQSAYTDKADRLNAGTDGLLSALSQLQRALGDMTRSVQAAGDALDEKADKEG